MGAKENLCIIVPCYNEEDVLYEFYEVTNRILEKDMNLSDYEILFVNDGSRDNTNDIIKELSEKDEHVQFLTFSRNFGKESAMYAGLKYSNAEYTVIMDADLQHPPEILCDMYKEMQSGQYDMIATRRKNRDTDTRFRAFCSRTFYKIMNKISGIDMGNDALDYRMFNKRAKKAMLAMTEYNRFSKGIFEWIGYRTKWIEIDIAERAAGNSKWSFRKLISYSLEGCVAFSTMPLALSSLFGFVFCTIALLMIILMVVNSIVNGVNGSGFASIICTVLLVGGVQLFCVGILGQYLAKAYLETKNRPIFLLQEMSEKKIEMYEDKE